MAQIIHFNSLVEGQAQATVALSDGGVKLCAYRHTCLLIYLSAYGKRHMNSHCLEVNMSIFFASSFLLCSLFFSSGLFFFRSVEENTYF